MRIARCLLLPKKTAFHYIWRCINGEMFLKTGAMKEKLLESYFKFFKRARAKVLVYSYCVMSNHFHMAAELLSKSKYMSLWARAANSSIAQKINKLLERRGPVGQDRPKTIVAEDAEALKRIMFYGDWNPVAAGMVDHPSKYKYSTYNYYAYGKTNRFTKHITQPKWYVELAENPEERQAEYRRQCDAYWADKQRRLKQEEAEEAEGIGSAKFVDNRNRLMKAMRHQQRYGTIPRAMLKEMAYRLTEAECSAASPQASPCRPEKLDPPESGGQ